jgi:hypothetical protein
MDSNKKTARIAGLFYLVVVVTGVFSLLYVPSKLIVWDNAAATFNNIVASETLFRLGVVAGIICYTAFLILPFILYRILHHNNRPIAVMMVVLATISVPISLINLNNKLAVLTLIGKAGFLSAFETVERHTQVLLSLEYYNNGIQIASVFWGLWLLPFGYLVFQSGFLPKIFGVLLINDRLLWVSHKFYWGFSFSNLW